MISASCSSALVRVLRFQVFHLSSSCRSLPHRGAQPSNVSKSYESSWRIPLMKKVGVPFTPLRTPLRKSSWTRSAWTCSASSLLEQVEIELERTSVRTKVVDLQMLLVLVEVIVHLPEPVLGGSGLGRLRRVLGMRMRGTDREVAEHEPELLSHPFLDLLDDRVGLPAVGALIVAVLHEGHRRIRRALDVIPLLRHRQDRGWTPIAWLSSCDPLRREILERQQDAVRPRVHLGRRDVAPAHDASRIDHEERALTGSVLRPIDAVRSRHLPLGSKSANNGNRRCRSFAKAR